MILREAYLIVVCNEVTNAIEEVLIWSSPEWEQSRVLPNVRVYIAYCVSAESFQEAKDALLDTIKNPSNRYHYLWKIWNDFESRKLKFMHRINAK